uniref:Neurofascin-like n=1 Tax=Sinocyclocheilus anshuiensis TaxID=1608454 RepID=A0A671QR08_9TELE
VTIRYTAEMRALKCWRIPAILTILQQTWILAMDIPPDGEELQPPMIFKESPQDYIVDPVDPIIVECEATGNPPPVFTWTRNGVYLNVARDPQVSMRWRSGTLEIFFWGRPNDYEGVYQCTATNEFGSALSSYINLRVSKARTWLKEYLEPVSVVVGLPLILPCNPPVGPPKPGTYWLNSTMAPIRQDRRVSKAENGDLYFSSIVAEDALTNYVCVARFPFTNTIQQKPPLILFVKCQVLCQICVLFYVYVARMAAHTAPKFLKPKGTASTTIAMLGEELIVECFAAGVPTPFIKWTKDWEEMSMTGKKLENFNKTLRIKNVSMDDGGDYICTASNRMGSLDHVITVRVKSVPFWVEKPESLVLSRDDSGSIVCRADGIPRPQIQWLVNGEPIIQADSTAISWQTLSWLPRLLGPRDELIKTTEGNHTHLDCPYFGSPKPDLRWSKGGLGTLEGSRHRILPNGTLEIRNTKLQDQGSYVCVASNVIGRDEKEVQLEVKEPIKIVRAPHNTVVIRGSLARFDCKIKFDSTLDVTVTWLKDKKFLILGRRMTKDEDSLSIADVYRRDEGVYTCRVKSELEEVTASAKLTVMGTSTYTISIHVYRPDPPSDLEISDPSERSVRLTWVPGLSNHSPIKGTHIYINIDANKNNLSSYPGSLNSVILQLTPFVEYRFRVIAVNGIGPSKPSWPSEYYQTGGAVPDAIPRNIQGMGSGVFRNNMEISWEPLEYREWNGPKLGYMVWWRRRDSREEWKNYTTYWWCSYIIYDTDTFTPYEIKVQAVNFFGYGPESTIVLGYSGEDRPVAAPSDLSVSDIESSTLTVHWEPVSRLWLVSQVYYWRENSRLPWHTVSRRIKTKSFKANGPRLSGTLTGLVPYSNYRMYIVVANNRYEGPPSNTIEFQTPEGVPSIPRSFRIMHRHYDTIYLDWEEPAEPNGILTGYILKYQTLNVTLGDRIQVEYVPPNITYFSLRRFDRYTRYKFSLAAQTEVGVGEAFTEESPHFTTEGKVSSFTFIWSLFLDIVTQGWFIGLMCAVALLVLIMLIVFFIKRSRGGKYPALVSIKKLTDHKPLNGSHIGRRTNSDDSLMEYGEGEEIEFNEDGSFIGEYTGVSKRNMDRSPYHDSSEPTSPVAIYSFA